MSEHSKISWTNSTFNPWWGCEKVSPGCANCYAESLDKRFHDGIHWGPNAQRKKISDSTWKLPLRWNKKAAEKYCADHMVFCGSMCDWCDPKAPEGERDRLFDLIKKTPYLTWQLLTKRADRIADCLPDDWGNYGYPNVWLGVSVEDKRHGLPRIDALREIPAKMRFVSCEPLIENLGPSPINLFSGIDWVIVGGETGSRYREMYRSWVEFIHLHCRAFRVSFFFKQWSGCKGKADPFLPKEFPFYHP